MKRLKEVIAQVLQQPLADIDEDASMKTLRAWNSMRHVTLIMELEKIYGTTFSGAEITGMRSYRDIKNILLSKGICLPAA